MFAFPNNNIYLRTANILHWNCIYVTLNFNGEKFGLVTVIKTEQEKHKCCAI